MLRIDGRELAPRLVVLDKDGTLIAFDVMWRAWFDHLMVALTRLQPLDAEAETGLAATLGYDPATGVWDPLGPLTLASTNELALLIAGQLYRYCGLDWDNALGVVAQAEGEARAALEGADLVQPIGDVRGTLQRMVDSGLVLALATTDNRRPTEHALEKLGIASLFATIICGDDGIPLKPAPDMALEIVRRLNVQPDEAIMVGDSVADLTMARRAGLLCAVGVTSGAVPGEMLAPHADVVIRDIHAIEVLPHHKGGA